LAGQRGEAEATRVAVARIASEAAERMVALRGGVETGIQQVRAALAHGQGELRMALSADMLRQSEVTRASLEGKVAEIQRTVNEQLHAAVEKQMNDSFARVIDQFAAVQKAMGDVQAVTAQIGDIKRLFSNVKTRGGWGEAQVRALLDDILPAGSYETNCRVRPDSDEAVEFAVRMPARGCAPAPLLPIDAKFPVEDYERILSASEAGDAEAERAARKGLERTVREQARRIAAKYIAPPATVEFAVKYLPTDGLYAEVARLPGAIDEIGRACRVLVPSLFPALLRTIHLGIVSLTLEQKADQVRELLGATRTEMLRMDEILVKLLKSAGAMANTIEAARRRTRAVQRVLREVEAVETGRAEAVLEIVEEEVEL
jgi:DNA recombination protein RmuC